MPAPEFWSRTVLASLVVAGLSFCLVRDASAQVAPLPAEIVPQLGHQSEVNAVAISRDGRFIASGSDDHTIKLWDVDSGRQLRVFSGHTGNVESVAFSPDGRSIVSGSGDQTVKLWDLESGRELRSFAGHTSGVKTVAFSPDGRRIVSGSDSSIKLWDAESGRGLRDFTGHTSFVEAVVFSPDGRRIVSGGTDNTIRLWDLESGRELRSFTGVINSVSSVAFSPNGRWIASGDGGREDKTVRLWDADTGRELRRFSGHTQLISAVAFSADGRRIVSGSRDNTIKLWDAESGRELRTFTGHSSAVFAVAVSADGRRIVSGGNDKTIKLWDLESGRELRTFRGLALAVYAVAVSPDGRRMLSGGGDKTIKLWDIEAGRELRSFEGHTDVVVSVAFSPDGRRIASCSGDNTIKIWDADGGQELRTLRGHANWLESVAFSPDGRRIVSGSGDKTIKVWDADSGREFKTLTGHTDYVSSVRFSPDGQRLVSGSRDNTVRLWNLKGGRELRRFVGHTRPVTSAALSPDGRRIVSGDLDNLIKLWDAESGRELRTFSGHLYSVTSVAFSPDGRRIVSGSGDHTIKLWDVETGRELRTLKGHVGYVDSVTFSPDGRRIISGAKDGTARIWDGQSGALLGTAMSFADGEWIFLTPEGFFDTSSPKAAQNLNIVRGLEVSSVDQVYNALYRPDLVREKLAGDPDGKVKAAAARLDLNKVMASGMAPKVAITSPHGGSSADKDQIAVDATVTDQGGGVGKVEWRVNGVTLGIETRGLARVTADAVSGPGKALTVHRSLALERGQNRIEVLAYNARDLIASEPASVTVNWDGEKGAAPPKLFVMAVGVNDYYDSRLKLSYAVPDATAIAEGFRKAGTGLYASVDVTTVLDKEVTIANMDKVFTDVGSRVQPRDVFVFFLAGHGKTKNGRYYFLPRDFRYEDEDSIEKTGMDQDKFQAWFAKISARKSILLYDTCESGSLTGNNIRGSDIDERLGALNRMTRATGRTFLTATTDDAPALEGYHGHGVFTYAILDALDHGDVNKNGLIEVSELADYVDQKVPDISFDAFKLRQIPQRSIVGNNFALANKTEILAATGATSAAAATPIAPGKATHVVIAPSSVFDNMGTAGQPLLRLPAGTLVTVTKNGNGWSLIAKDGKPLGYVASVGLAPVQ